MRGKGLNDFGEKALRNIWINIVLKFGETASWYGRVGELVVRVEAQPFDHVIHFTVAFVFYNRTTTCNIHNDLSRRQCRAYRSEFHDCVRPAGWPRGDLRAIFYNWSLMTLCLRLPRRQRRHCTRQCFQSCKGKSQTILHLSLFPTFWRRTTHSQMSKKLWLGTRFKLCGAKSLPWSLRSASIRPIVKPQSSRISQLTSRSFPLCANSPQSFSKLYFCKHIGISKRRLCSPGL